MTEPMYRILSQFALDSQAIACEPYGKGLINRTFLVTTESGKRYILQQMNHNVFPNIDGLMANIQAVTAHLAKRAENPRYVMGLVDTLDGAPYITDEQGDCWRVIVYVEDAVCLQKPESTEDFYQCAVAFGRFQQMLRDFPAHTLCEVIPDFHNTARRLETLREIIEKDPVGRVASVKSEIEFALQREKEAATLVELLEEGKLPLRVTHNDTKINNVMLDAATRTALCVIDLDTVMPGLSLYDYGDAVRSGAATAAEDEQDLSKVTLDLELFEAFTKGFLSACPDLTSLERELMPLGVKIITLELGVRFLTDYLDGDHYFAPKWEGHNLDRCRSQFALVADIEKKFHQMTAIVNRLTQ